MDENALVNINGSGVPTIDILLLLTIISLLPSIIIMMTTFTRIIIILSFTRNALGIQQTPPNMVLVGIALFLTLFIMNPVLTKINTEAYQPYKNGQITQETAIQRAQVPLKQFMLKQTDLSAVDLFTDLAKTEGIEKPEDLPMTVVIPAFMTTELKRGFMAGFLLYIPFLLIDIIVSSVLMSMGMIMLPPATIALPFKLLLFVTLDGWALIFKTIVESVHW